MDLMERIKPRYPRELALECARDITARIQPHCERLVFAGSLRRRLLTVGDVEFLFIGKLGTFVPDGALFPEAGDLAQHQLDCLLRDGVFSLRRAVDGRTCYGAKNKLLVHEATGIPVDAFTATERSWGSYLVCRTGPKDFNIRVAQRAQEMGLHWDPYIGLRGDHGLIETPQEEDFFRELGWEYVRPEGRR